MTSNANYNLTSWLGADDLSAMTRDEVRTQILEPCLRDGPITLSVADFNLAEANVDAKTICNTIQTKMLKLGFKQICASSSSSSARGTAISPTQLWNTSANRRQAPMARW